MLADPLAPGRVAVITGASSGLGYATALKCAKLGMKVCMADIDGPMLDAATERVAEAAAEPSFVISAIADVGVFSQMNELRDAVLSEWGEVAFLMNNAGVGIGSESACANLDACSENLQTNLFGVLHGVQAFVPGMVAQGTRCVVVNTGSKQGLTTPPGNLAYNVGKAGVKVLTEGLQHELRQSTDGQVSAHLFVPGWVNTMLGYKWVRETKAAAGEAFEPAEAVSWSGGSPLSPEEYEEKPAAGAWSAEETVEYLFEAIAAGRFYIICPDNDVSEAMDRKRIMWAAGDITERDVPLSRWHPDHKEAFAEYMARD